MTDERSNADSGERAVPFHELDPVVLDEPTNAVEEHDLIPGTDGYCE